MMAYFAFLEAKIQKKQEFEKISSKKFARIK